MAVDKSIYDGMDQLAAGLTTPEQEEKLRRASLNRQRILAVGDALRNIGNIYNTVHYAPSQQFNSPVEMERKFYREDKAQRDAVNQRYMAYKAQRDALELKKKAADAELNYKNSYLNYLNDTNRRLWSSADEKARHNKETEEIQRMRAQNQRDYYEGKIGIDQYNANSRRISALAAAQNADTNQFKAENGVDESGTVSKYNPSTGKFEQVPYQKNKRPNGSNSGGSSTGGSLLPKNPTNTTGGGGTLLPKK